MLKSVFWWLLEAAIWYIFFYLILFSCRNSVNIGWTAFILVLIGSFGIFASPLTRHLSIWNKVLDKIIKREEEQERW